MILRLPDGWSANATGLDIVQDETTTWDEDIVMATWNGWEIWIDGGKGLSVWQCSLIEPHELNQRPWHLLRDFVDTLDEVQAWLDRAVRIADKAHTDRTHGTQAGEQKT